MCLILALVGLFIHGASHVVDQRRGLVVQVNQDTGAQTTVAEPGIGADNLAFDRRGRIYVSNAHDGGIMKYSGHGRGRACRPRALYASRCSP